MPETYTYKARDKSGNLVNGSLEADSEGLVLQRLREMGYTPLEASKKSAGMNLEINLRPGKVKLKEVAVFSRQFATMVNSGLPILRALAILGEQTESKELKKSIVGVRMEVEHGSSLSGGMSKFPKAFNDLYIAMVKSGETGGMLDEVLLRLADEIEKEVHLRQKIKSAMTYPIAVVGLVFLIMSAMLLFVVPQFQSIYGELGGTLPLPTRLLLVMSQIFKSYWWIVLALTIAFVQFFKRYKKTESGRSQIDAFKLRVPIFGNLFHKTA
nr:type II secretion system F family protein [Actinomycetota bacterium]